MICNKCNSEIPENSKFCQVCGSAINPLENVDPIINNFETTNSNSLNNQNINTNDVIKNTDNYSQINNINNQQQPIQNNNNKNDNGGLKTVSILLGIIGIVAMFFHSTIASIIFIIGIIVGAIYKSKTKNKCFGLALNIIGLILNIIFFFGAVLIVNNTLNDVRKSAECAEKGGYWENGKCIGAIVDEDEGLEDNKKEQEKENNSNTNDNLFNSNNSDNSTYIGLWSCKDNGTDTSMSIKPLDQIDESEYKIGLTFVDNQKYMITYSSSKWEKGSYTIALNKKDLTGFIYYDLNITIGESYESGNYQILDSISKKYQFVVDESYSRAFVIASDGSANYSCYKD